MEHLNGVTTLHPWSQGMNNKAHEKSLPPETVRNAVNTDFKVTGDIAVRAGVVRRIYETTDGKGGYSCPAGVFFVDGTTMYMLNSDDSATAAYSGITGQTFAYHYDESNGVVYFSDGVRCLKIVDGSVLPWGMSPPSPPVLSASPGAYGGGTYLAAFCYVDADGVESGLSPIVAIDLPDDTGIFFSGLVTTFPGNAVATRIYLSTANGKELYHVADTTAATYTLAAGRYDEGAVNDTHFVFSPPAGRIIRTYNGRKYVADAFGTVWYSDIYAPDHFRLGESYIQFPAPVDIMEPVAGGIFFAYGNRTDFYSGNPEDGFTIVKRFDYGGVYGTGRVVPDKQDPNIYSVMWQSHRGAVIGTPDGQCRNIQGKHVAPDKGEEGAAMVREKDGLVQFVASLKNTTASPMAARDFIEAEVIRRGA